jgi:hypothetical protein
LKALKMMRRSMLLARILYAAVLLSVLGAFPRQAGERGQATPEPQAEPSVRATWTPRPDPREPAGAAGRHGIARNPADFAIPRIQR